MRLDLPLLIALLALAACDNAPTTTARPDPSATAAAPRTSPVVATSVEGVPAGEGDVAALVKAERDKARAEGRTLVVYVGATWCEPCRYFHAAVDAHELDGKLPPIRLLEFDLDRDETRLRAAGYGTNYVPLFVIPDGDGRGTTRRIAGSIKGPGAVDEITPRLTKLVAG